MRSKGVIITAWVAFALVIFAFAFFAFAIITPSEQFDEISGFGKVFAASPEFAFDTGSFVVSFGDFSFNINFTFEKPVLSLLSGVPEIHVNVIFFVILLGALAVSCVIPEISIATTIVITILSGICVSHIPHFLRESVAAGASSWDVAASSFWCVSFLLTVLVVNGLVGIIARILGAIILSTTPQIIVTLIAATVLANAVALFLCLFVYLTVGIGWFGGVMLWFVIAFLFDVFCEIMNILEF